MTAIRKLGLMYANVLSMECILFKKIIAKKIDFHGMIRRHRPAQEKLLIGFLILSGLHQAGAFGLWVPIS
jgi:hypothetical protein